MRRASSPVIFCSRIAGSSASNTAPDLPIRRPRPRRAPSTTAGWTGTSVDGSSSSPRYGPAPATASAAPGPHARTRTPPGHRLEEQRRGAGRSPGRDPDRARLLDPERRVVAATPMDRERAREVVRRGHRHDRLGVGRSRARAPARGIRHARETPNARRAPAAVMAASLPSAVHRANQLHRRGLGAHRRRRPGRHRGARHERGPRHHRTGGLERIHASRATARRSGDDEPHPRPREIGRSGRAPGRTRRRARAHEPTADRAAAPGCRHRREADADAGSGSGLGIGLADRRVLLVRPRLLRQRDGLRPDVLEDDPGRRPQETLPCGTRVTFRNPKNGRTITVKVIDRGPYVAGRLWDLSYATCSYLDNCYTA